MRPLVDLDIGEGVIVIAAVAAVFSVLGSGIYLLIESPNLLSEAVFQAGLAAGVFKSARGMMGDHWLGGVLKKTFLPFLLVVLAALAFGWLVNQKCDPDLTRLSDFPSCAG